MYINDLPIIGLAIVNSLYWLIFSYRSSERYHVEIDDIVIDVANMHIHIRSTHTHIYMVCMIIVCII